MATDPELREEMIATVRAFVARDVIPVAINQLGQFGSMHDVNILWDDPNDAPDAGKQLYTAMFPIAACPNRGPLSMCANDSTSSSGSKPRPTRAMQLW